MKSPSKPRNHTVGRVVSAGLAVLFQIAWLIFAVIVLNNRFPFISVVISFFSLVAILAIVSTKDMNPSYKLAWSILILAVPVAGAVIYLWSGFAWGTKRLKRRMETAWADSAGFLSEKEEDRLALEEASLSASRQSGYIRDNAGFPAYQNTTTQYYEIGEELYKELLARLEAAEHFIFMEYFIIDDGEMWEGILDVLEKKVRLGLDVRLIYDDFGCASTMPEQFQLSLQRRGIRCEVFNPVLPIASVIQNHRDHRKITVIDGYIAFTGGINLADEYINKKLRFGHWKDTGVMLIGEGVWNFTVMFLQMWNVLSNDKPDYAKFMPHVWHEEPFTSDGFVQPYNDSPLDTESVGENVYLNMINRAEQYVYIFTPYLITDNEVVTALSVAAKSGVDVRIVTPGIPDKKLVFLLTQSYYDALISAGVKIYEYQPGFLHAKSFVSDDKFATVGTINLDYRSLYLHFECGVWMYDSSAVMQLKEDMLCTFKECKEITLEECKSKGSWTKIWQSVLRLFAPLL